MGNRTNSEDYDVGYGKTPRKTQFQKGRPGNSRGRPRGSKGLSACLLDPFMQKIPIKVRGRTRTVSQVEAIMMLQLKTALDGDAAAANRLFRMLPLLTKIAEAEALRDTAEEDPGTEPVITHTDTEVLQHFVQLAADGNLNFEQENTDD